MEKLVTWLGNFSKRLKTNPELVNQDNAVMSAMRGAVRESVGQTIEAQEDLTSSLREEKEHEGVDYGDN